MMTIFDFLLKLFRRTDEDLLEKRHQELSNLKSSYEKSLGIKKAIVNIQKYRGFLGLEEEKNYIKEMGKIQSLESQIISKEEEIERLRKKILRKI